jgi:diguanylate cyclase (GGDEF)-like protein/PAS domain S-box-containing protein
MPDDPMDDIKKISYRIIGLSVAASMIFWMLDAVMDMLIFSNGPFIEVLLGKKKEFPFRLLTSAFFIGFGIFAARVFAGQKRVEQNLIKEIARRKCTEDALRTSEEKYRSLVESTDDSIYLVDRSYRYIYMNKNHIATMGFSGGEWQGRSYGEFHLSDETEWFMKNVDMVFSTGRSVQHEHKSIRDDRCYLQTLSPVKDPDGRIIAVTIVSKDISELKMMEEKLHALSVTDELTGLCNRRGFFTFADRHVKLANRRKTKVFMLYFDLDGLKRINDTLGHKAGDLALGKMAGCLKKSFRDSDAIARIGGDEFVVFPVEAKGDSISNIIDRFQRNLEACDENAGRGDALSASIGAACYDPENPCSLDELLIQADRNMYERKGLNHKSQS